MKRIFTFVVIGMFVASSLFAHEATIIDFSLLTADINVPAGGRDDGRPNQNRQTMMDFSSVAGGGFTTQQREVMRTSLAIENWDVTLSSSARTVQSIGLSFTREAPSRQWGTVMGVRIHFPIEPHNAWAMIRPPFEIPAYDFSTVDADGNISAPENGMAGRSRFEAQEDGQPAFGVVRNVGAIRAVAVNVYGLNFPHSLTTIFLDHEGNERRMFMGNLNFDGWGELQWNNPQYIQEVRNRELRVFPLYPFSTPFVKFGGFLIQRDASHAGGDFITYFKDVKLIYDRAVLDAERDIDDEAIWGIINARETARKVWEMERFGHGQVLRFLEAERQAQVDEVDLRGRPVFTPSPTNE